jgi:hypothetical protein
LVGIDIPSLYAKIAARIMKITRPSRMGPMKEARAARMAANMLGLPLDR